MILIAILINFFTLLFLSTTVKESSQARFHFDQKKEREREFRTEKQLIPVKHRLRKFFHMER